MSDAKARLHHILESKRQAEAQLRNLNRVTSATTASDKAQKEYLREAAKREKATEKEVKRLYTESQLAHVAVLNEELEQQIADLEGILEATLGVDDFLDLDTLKNPKQLPAFQPSIAKPNKEEYLVPRISGVKQILPWEKSAYQKKLEAARDRYIIDVEQYKKEYEKYQEQATRIKEQILAQHAEIEKFKQRVSEGSPEALVDYFALVVEASSYPDAFPQKAKLAYVPESKQLVVEYDLPSIKVIPDVQSYNYVKTRDETTAKARPQSQINKLYTSMVAQLALRTVHELFEADRADHLEVVVFNGYVTTLDKASGHDVRVCLVTLSTYKEEFLAINLARVDPELCLKSLKASVSKSPAELAPVRPVVEFDMVDPRFVEETDVLSGLDQRQNLMELSPVEFENLITNLFSKMGLETRQTQASRDGGVDCVAYDPRPILGGKVVIQAKRYKNTVGVSAVRDLFGTMQNEGASKGILVTTST